MLATVDVTPATKGLMLKIATVVDTVLIAAPNSTMPNSTRPAFGLNQGRPSLSRSEMPVRIHQMTATKNWPRTQCNW